MIRPVFMDFICYNHRILPQLPPHNPASRHGVGLIETMLWENGRIPFWSDHFDRLTASAARLNWSSKNLEQGALFNSVQTLIHQNEMSGKCRLRLEAFPETGDTGFLIETFPFPQTRPPLRVGLAKSLVKNADAYSDLKTNARHIYQLARKQAEAQGWSDALLLNREGRIVESTIANIFWIKNKQVYTPPLEEGCVAGLMRKQILTGKVPIHNLPVSEKILSIEEARAADQLLLTNALRGIRSIDLFESAR
jgi:branched-chain amino acid aminotransferase